MNRTSYKNKYLYAGFFICIPVAIYTGSFIFLQASRAEAEKIENARAFEADTQNFRATLTKSLTLLADDRARLEAHFVRKDGIVDFINGLEKLGTDSNVEASISSLGESWQDGQSTATDGTLSLSLHVAGSFTDLYRYSTLLEEVPQKLVLDDIQMTSGEGGGAPSSIKALTAHKITWSADIRATVLHYIK